MRYQVTRHLSDGGWLNQYSLLLDASSKVCTRKADLPNRYFFFVMIQIYKFSVETNILSAIG